MLLWNHYAFSFKDQAMRIIINGVVVAEKQLPSQFMNN